MEGFAREPKEFVAHTDNKALEWLRINGNRLDRIGRWILRLVHFKFEVIQFMGSENSIADCLSRIFNKNMSLKIPCLWESFKISLFHMTALGKPRRMTPAVS